MKAYRMGRNTTEHYTSFEEAAAAWHCKPFSRKTKDENKLLKQQNDFCERHKCPACGQPMSFVGGSWMTCKNEKCKGIKDEYTDAEGNKITSYRVSCKQLDAKGAEIANVIFS